MSNATPAVRCCEVCGAQLRKDNKSGICGNPKSVECTRERARRHHAQHPQKSRKIPVERRERCEICGKPLNRDNMMGVCAGKGSGTDCAQERGRRQRQGYVASREPAITAGQVFGKWTALDTCAFAEESVPCRCECGRERPVRARELVTEASRDCGCDWRVTAARTRRPGPYLLAGTPFGRLTLMEDAPHSNYRVLCRCECDGTEARVLARTLNAGRSRSCGCLSRDIRRTHGLSRHSLYGTWRGMLLRCSSPASPNWEGYGGRGITVCERWHDLRLFVEDIERDLGPRPKGMTLDRTDNDGNYEPGNVRWADKKTQRTNQRTVAQMTRERDAARRERDEAIRERDAFAVEVDRLTALLASREPKTPAVTATLELLF